MCRKSPQLPAMTENDLIEAPLKRSLKDVVARGAHINVAVIAAGSLWVNCANSSRVFGKLFCVMK
jgi:hypothetical protein